MATAGVLAGCSTETSGDGGDGGDTGDGGDGGDTGDGGDGGDTGDGGDGGSQETPAWPSYLDDATVQGTEDATGESEVTIAVGPDAALVFEPTKLIVDSGTTVTFEFESGGHNVKPNSQPDGGGLDGTEGGEMALVDEGETYSVTLDTAGMYTYYCGPHQGAGMKGGISVQ